MPTAIVQLEKQEYEARAGEVAYQFRLSNNGAQSLQLLSLVPRVPEGVRLVAVKDASQVAVGARVDQLCSELSHLLGEYLFLNSPEYRQTYQRLASESLKEVLSTIGSRFWRIYFDLFTGAFFRALERSKARAAALSYKIENLADAEHAFKYFVDDPASRQLPALRSLYAAKLDQLKALVSKRKDQDEESLADVEPGSFFATTYVLQFDRYVFNTRRYTFSVECRYSERGRAERYTSEASSVISITPQPVALSVIAIVSSLLGVALKSAIDTPAGLAAPESFFPMLLENIFGGPGLGAAILALVAFNIFEQTNLAKASTLGVSWRSALVIGVSSGVFGNRVLAALKAFLGV